MKLGKILFCLNKEEQKKIKNIVAGIRFDARYIILDGEMDIKEFQDNLKKSASQYFRAAGKIRLSTKIYKEFLKLLRTMEDWKKDGVRLVHGYPIDNGDKCEIIPRW